MEYKVTISSLGNKANETKSMHAKLKVFITATSATRV